MTDRYQLSIEPEVLASRKALPGHIRQCVKQSISELVQNPRPHNSQPLEIEGLGVPPEIELRRIRLEKWRIIYAIHEGEGWIWVWGIRERPPYDYDDLEEMMGEI